MRQDHRAERACRQCDGKFSPRRVDQWFCSPEHKTAWWKDTMQLGIMVRQSGIEQFVRQIVREELGRTRQRRGFA